MNTSYAMFDSEIRNQKSEIGNQKSEINNRLLIISDHVIKDGIYEFWVT